jgi:hypothetical protein
MLYGLNCLCELCNLYPDVLFPFQNYCTDSTVPSCISLAILSLIALKPPMQNVILCIRRKLFLHKVSKYSMYMWLVRIRQCHQYESSDSCHIQCRFRHRIFDDDKHHRSTKNMINTLYLCQTISKSIDRNVLLSTSLSQYWNIDLHQEFVVLFKSG